MKILMAAMLLSLAPTIAVAQDAAAPTGTSPGDDKIAAVRAELADRARGACMNDLAVIVAQRNDLAAKVAALQKELDDTKKGGTPPKPEPPK